MIAVGPPFAGFIEFARYASRETAMVIWETESFTGPPLVKPTVSLVPYGARDPGERGVWIKTWAENRGVLECLVASGVITRTDHTHPCGPTALAYLCTLTDAAFAELQRQENP